MNEASHCVRACTHHHPSCKGTHPAAQKQSPLKRSDLLEKTVMTLNSLKNSQQLGAPWILVKTSLPSLAVWRHAIIKSDDERERLTVYHAQLKTASCNDATLRNERRQCVNANVQLMNCVKYNTGAQRIY